MTQIVSSSCASPPPRLFTVEEYLRMAQVGILTEIDDVELLEGRIVTRIPRDPPHNTALILALQVFSRSLPQGFHIRPQSAIRTPDSAPEPDLAIVRGDPRDYAQRHPSAQDVALVVEVADTSLFHDRGDKLCVYARAAIAAYWIINVRDRQIEIYTDPTGPDDTPIYRIRRDISLESSAILDVPRLEIPVRDILPA